MNLKRKKFLAEFKPKPWKSSRPKPFIDPDLWDADVADELAFYMDWHGRHEHCVSPRTKKPGELIPGQMQDEDDPKKIYAFASEIYKPPPLPKEYAPRELGANGMINEVSVLATAKERETVIKNNYENDSAWILSTVKDELETNHIDGTYTTNKTKPMGRRTWKGIVIEPDDPKVLLKKWGWEFFEGFGGGEPTSFSESQRERLDKSSLGHVLKEPRKPINPWKEQKQWTQFSKTGVSLDPLSKTLLLQQMDDAIRLYEESGDLSVYKRKKLEPKSMLDQMKAAFWLYLKRLFACECLKAVAKAAQKATQIVVPSDESTIVTNTAASATVASALPNGSASIAEGSALTTFDPSLSILERSLANSVTVDGSSLLDGTLEEGEGGVVGSSVAKSKDYTIKELDIRDREDQLDTIDENAADAAALGDDNESIRTGVSSLTALTRGGVHKRNKTSKRKKREDEASQLTDFEGEHDEWHSSEVSFLATMRSKIQDGGVSVQLANDDYLYDPNTMYYTVDHSTVTRPNTSISESTGKPKKKKVKPPKKKIVELENDPYVEMMFNAGGEEKLERLSDTIIAYTAKMKKESKVEQDLFAGNMSLIDAAIRGQPTKTLYNLAIGGDANAISNDVPLFLVVFDKLLSIALAQHIMNVDDDESDDFVRYRKVCEMLIKYGADKDKIIKTKPLAPIHLSAQLGCAKLVKWLLGQGSDILLRCEQDKLTPIQYAGKYGHVYVIMVCLEAGAPLDEQDELSGYTILHYAAMYGQTRTAMFLLRIGANKSLKDKKGLTPGMLAIEQGYQTTGGAIFAYMYPKIPSKTLIDFWYEEDIKKNRPKTAAEEMLGTLSAFGNMIGASLTAGFGSLGDMFKKKKNVSLDLGDQVQPYEPAHGGGEGGNDDN